MARSGRGKADEADDPARSMVVDRVRRADGRYLLYYEWPDAQRDDGEPGAEAARAESPQAEPDV